MERCFGHLIGRSRLDWQNAVQGWCGFLFWSELHNAISAPAPLPPTSRLPRGVSFGVLVELRVYAILPSQTYLTPFKAPVLLLKIYTCSRALCSYIVHLLLSPIPSARALAAVVTAAYLFRQGSADKIRCRHDFPGSREGTPHRSTSSWVSSRNMLQL